ncbi:class A sortase [Miniphocaeibacter halophilus]|uniref:Class A sortase n=1 Tax=Miniphocaeibacter halophilus TaxID=2931922 RepID=A0AC61MS14_9FIRM|nr:class A sortase [Miniphocaeibacter halophilus]QQK08409.1 class A sortase [Miniphocaeibacter halophilus]
MNKKKIFGLIIIIIGIIFIFITPIMKFFINNKVDNTLNDFEELKVEEIENNNEEKADFDFENISEISPSKVLLNPGEINKNLIVGQIVIPSLDLNLTIFKGLSENELFAGVGTMKNNQIMGKGNYAIAGHYAENNTLFGDLTSIKIGDIVKITDKNNIYEYEIYDTKVVDPNQIDLIEDTESEKRGNPIISLMNCYYEGKKFTGNRFFAFGDLVSVKEYREEEMIRK